MIAMGRQGRRVDDASSGGGCRIKGTRMGVRWSRNEDAGVERCPKNVRARTPGNASGVVDSALGRCASSDGFKPKGEILTWVDIESR